MTAPQAPGPTNPNVTPAPNLVINPLSPEAAALHGLGRWQQMKHHHRLNKLERLQRRGSFNHQLGDYALTQAGIFEDDLPVSEHGLDPYFHNPNWLNGQTSLANKSKIETQDALKEMQQKEMVDEHQKLINKRNGKPEVKPTPEEEAQKQYEEDYKDWDFRYRWSPAYDAWYQATPQGAESFLKALKRKQTMDEIKEGRELGYQQSPVLHAYNEINSGVTALKYYKKKKINPRIDPLVKDGPITGPTIAITDAHIAAAKNVATNFFDANLAGRGEAIRNDLNRPDSVYNFLDLGTDSPFPFVTRESYKTARSNSQRRRETKVLSASKQLAQARKDELKQTGIRKNQNAFLAYAPDEKVPTEKQVKKANRILKKQWRKGRMTKARYDHKLHEFEHSRRPVYRVEKKDKTFDPDPVLQAKRNVKRYTKVIEKETGQWKKQEEKAQKLENKIGNKLRKASQKQVNKQTRKANRAAAKRARNTPPATPATP